MSSDERVLVDYRTSDDAGVYRIDEHRALVQTVDFFTPVVDDPVAYGRIAGANALSVRETEALVKRAAAPAGVKPEKTVDVHTREAEEKLRLALGTRARIVRKGKGGRIEIDFASEDELQRIYELLTER